LKCDIVFDYTCRLLHHMRERGYASCVPVPDPSVTPEPLLNLDSGYILRSVQQLPRQGSRAPWRLRQNYALDAVTLKLGGIEDDVLRFERAGDRVAAVTPSAAASIAA
jgi:hypothetical protein